MKAFSEFTVLLFYSYLTEKRSYHVNTTGISYNNYFMRYIFGQKIQMEYTPIFVQYQFSLLVHGKIERTKLQ